MKSLVLYYSHSGKTARTAYKLHQALQAKGESDIVELRHRDEKRYKIRHFFARFLPALTTLGNIIPEFNKYDIVALGSPVWAGRPAPLACRALSMLYKDCGCRHLVYFQIYGIDQSGEASIEYVRRALKNYPADKVHFLNLSLNQAHDEKALDRAIEKLSNILS